MPPEREPLWIDYPPLGTGGAQQARPEAPERFCGYLYIADASQPRGVRQIQVWKARPERRRAVGFQPARARQRKTR